MVAPSIIILAIVFILIAIRKAGSVKLGIWQVMLAGALLVLVTGQITPLGALGAINFDVLVFLFCMFVVGAALEESGYLENVAYRVFKRAKSMDMLVFSILFGSGMLSAILLNDTVAIIGVPAVLFAAKKRKASTKPLLFALAFGITIGSVPSPIGNPQNLIIAINGTLANPFVTFLWHLALPSVINLFAAYLLLKFFYPKEFETNISMSNEPRIKDGKLAGVAKLSIAVIAVFVAGKIALTAIGIPNGLPLTWIALAAVLPVLLLSKRRFELVKKADWRTLVFFAAMFVLMQSVWDSGFFQEGIYAYEGKITSPEAIIAASIILSQFISNVPLVALYLPLLIGAGAGINEMMLLAAGSTIAGNLSILGAASNVIIIQNAEKRNGGTLTFFEFLKIGVPLTVINAIVYLLLI